MSSHLFLWSPDETQEIDGNAASILAASEHGESALARKASIARPEATDSKAAKVENTRPEPAAEVPTKTAHNTNNTLALPASPKLGGHKLSGGVPEAKPANERINSKPENERTNSRPKNDRIGTADSQGSDRASSNERASGVDRTSGEGRLKPLLPRTITFTDADYIAPPVVVRNESNLFLSLLIFAACIAGFVGIWYVLNDASTTMLTEVGKRISTTISGRMNFVVHSYLDFPLYVCGLLQSLQREGEFDVSKIDGVSTGLNRLFLDTVAMFDIAAVYVALNTGAMIYAKKEDAQSFVLGARAPGDSQTYFKYHVTNTTSGEYDGQPFFEDANYDPRERVWYQYCNYTGGWTPIYSYATRQRGITYFHPLYDSNKTKIGVMGVDMVLDQLQAKMADILNFEGGAGFIFDLNQTQSPYVLGSGGSLLTETLAILQEVRKNDVEKSDTVLTNEIIVSYAPMSYLNNIEWTLVFVVPQSVFMESVQQLNALSFFLAVLSLIGLAGALAFLSRVAPKVAQARLYRAQIVERYRKENGRVEFGNGRIGPPPESNPGRESLRQLSFQLDDDFDGKIDEYRITRENCFNCEYAVRKCGLVNNDLRLMSFLGLGMALIFGCMALMWISWTFRYSERTEFYYDKFIEQVSQNAYTETLGFMTFPGLALEFLGKKFNRGTLTLPFVDNATNAKYDRFFYDMMQTFKKPGLSNNWLMDMIYFADKGGHMQGVQVYENTSSRSMNSWSLRTVARDPTTNPSFTLNGQAFIRPCYEKYHINVNGTRDANQTNALFAQNCNYDPRKRTWYLNASNAKKPGWTFPYTFVSGDLGVTAFRPLYNPNNASDLLGVLAADARLSFVSQALQAIADEFTTIFITTTPDPIPGRAEAGWMVASSVANEKQTELVDDALIRLEALRAPDDLEQAAAQYLVLEDSYSGGSILETIPDSGSKQLDRLITDPFTAAAYITDDKGMKFLSLTLIRKGVYVDELAKHNSFTILFSIGVILLSYIFLSHGYESLREIVEFKSVEEAEATEDTLSMPEPPIEDLLHVMEMIGPLVKTAGTKPTLEQVQEWEDKDHEKLESETRRMISQAVFFLDCAARGQNVLMVCELKLQGKYWMFEILDNRLYRIGFQIILLVHQFLSFWEPPTPEDMMKTGVEDWLLALEFFILLFEISNCTMRCLINHKYLRNSQVGKTNARINKILNSNAIPLSDAIYATVLFLTCLDWLLTVLGRISFEYYFPMRPFLLLTCNVASFEALRSFVIAIFNARQVFMLMWSLFMISAVISFTFFRGRVNEDLFENNFESFFSSLLVMMTFVTTADNYPDLTASSMLAGGLGMIFYWIVWTFIGTFFMIAMFLSIFQTRFASVREKDLAEGVVRNRFSLCAAFLLIDMDDSAEVDIEEFGRFAMFLNEKSNQPNLLVKVLQFFFCASSKDSEVVHAVKSVNQSDIQKLTQAEEAANVDQKPTLVTKVVTPSGIEMDSFSRSELKEATTANETAAEMNEFFDRLNADGGGTLDIKEFVLGVEDLFELMKRKGINKKIFGYLWRDILESRRMATLRLSLVAIQLWMISFYGLVDSDATLDYLLTALLWIYVFEVLLSIWVYGPAEYWYYAKFHADVNFQGFFLRMELAVMMLSFMIWVALMIVAQAEEEPPFPLTFDTDSTRQYRVAFAIPALRLLGIIPGTRQLVNALLTVLPRFIPLLYLLLVFFFIYAVIGVTIMRGKFDALGDELDGTNWNSLENAMVALFMLLTGNNLSGTAYAAVRACGWNVIWYFLSFVGFITICFTNLFLGVLLDAFSLFLESEEKAQEDARESRRAGLSKTEVDFALTLSRERTLRSIG